MQPTYIDPISSNFNALSNQPSYDMQVAETHIFGARATNDFHASFSHYVAQFDQNDQLRDSTFPYGRINTGGQVPFTGFNPATSFPQGRNVTQYQFFDDFALNRGKHNFKFGFNFRRYDVSDHNFFYNSPGIYFSTSTSALANFTNGLAYRYTKALNFASDVPIAMWGLGLYAQDEWQATSNLKITLALRAERNSNPVCQFNCFANFMGAPNTLASFTSNNPGSVPYSSDIASGLHQAYPGVDALLLSPRIGFSWSPDKSQKTVISGGFMLAYDNPAAGLVDDLLANPPVAVRLLVQPAAGTAPFDPAGAPLTWQQSANAFALNKTYSQISSQLSALGSSFAAPAVTSIVGTVHAPQWKEWSLQVQRQLSKDTVVSFSYAGNSGTNIPYTNQWWNVYDQYGLYPGVAGVPASKPVANYGTLTTVQSGAISNYNGLTAVFTKRFAQSFEAHFSYTWSHGLDESSNGGIFTYGDSQTQSQMNPLGLRLDNYGNSDYDVRNNFTGDFLYNPTFHVNGALKHLVNGWQLSGKVFWRSGLPFSVTDGNAALGNFTGTIFATPLGNGWGGSTCGAAAAYGGSGIPCIALSHYVNSGSSNFSNYNSWSPQNRNQLRGPNFFDMDLALYKNFSIKEKAKLAVGIMAFNALNHPNFGMPDADISSPTFGLVTSMLGSPLSPYGTFLGFDSSVRVVQLTGKITF